METDEYLSLIRMIERLHRQFLEMVRKFIDSEGVRDFNAAQAVVPCHIDEGDMIVGELTTKVTISVPTRRITSARCSRPTT